VTEHPYYNQAVHGPYELYDVGDLTLEDGGIIRDASLAYATFGRLNQHRDNAILIPTWYAGSSKIFETAYIGAGRALDPARWFIIVVNQLGNGLSSSPSNTTSREQVEFPRVRIGDDVQAQHRLVTGQFGISRLALVTGGSMGAQQTFEWSVRFPDMVARAAPFCGTARTTEYNQLCVGLLADAIMSDPAWQAGRYGSSAEVELGLRRHANRLSVLGFSAEFYRRQSWRGLGFTRLADFLSGFLEAFMLPMDPNDLLCMAWKWQHADVSRHAGGDLAAALGRITARTFVMPTDQDIYFPPQDCETEQQMIRGSQLRVLTSPFGHTACVGIDADWMAQFDRHLNELLATPA
jgi:homoserine O-acetyltransferase